MKYLQLLLFVLLLIISSATHSQNSEKTQGTATIDCESDTVKLNKNELWACYISSNQMDSLVTLYTNNAIKVRSTGEIFEIADAIENYYAKKEVGIASINTLYRTKAFFAYEYEIGEFALENGDTYNHVVIWNNAKSKKRDFEFIAKAENNIPIDPQIEARRNQWVQLCNTHNALALVSELYTPNTVYYNHKPVVVGVENVAKEYGYMDNPNYSLSLTPLHLEMVTPSLAFEIGQCSGSYNGKYIIIWQKNSEGSWKVLVDSNI